jgi:hypothetical protein
MKLVSAVTSKVDRLRNRLFLSGLTRSQRVFVHSVRLSVTSAQAIQTCRVRILVRANGIVEAESHAETHLQEIVRGYQDASSGGEIEIKRLKPRELRPSTINDESESTLQLLTRMRRESRQVVSVVDPIEVS